MLKEFARAILIAMLAITIGGGLLFYHLKPELPEYYVAFSIFSRQPVTSTCEVVKETSCGINMFKCEQENVQFRCLHDITIIRVE